MCQDILQCEGMEKGMQEKDTEFEQGLWQSMR
jgi:hypothetical protein